MTQNSHLIYTTDLGPVCPDCGKPQKNCVCRQAKRKIVPETSGKVRVRYETVGRKGKGVTLISGLPLNQESLLTLARGLKQQFGTGGAVKDFVIELQGDQREKVIQALRKLGYSL